MFRCVAVSFIFSCLVQVHVEFSDGGDVIKIEGPPDESEKAREALENQAKELIRTMDYAEISVDAKYHKHIIGKGGSTGKFFKTSRLP
jgi:hypothetical protein